MTTKAAAALYLAQHELEWEGVPFACFNPGGKPKEELPAIYGFNNGGSPGWYSAVAVAADGTCLGGHICSHEGYMPSDLGMLEGSRPDRHEKDFQPHYPEGYRCEFVPTERIAEHVGLQTAIKLAADEAKAPKTPK